MTNATFAIYSIAEGHLVETCKAVCWIVVDRYVAICLSLYLAICVEPTSRVAKFHIFSDPEICNLFVRAVKVLVLLHGSQFAF